MLSVDIVVKLESAVPSDKQLASLVERSNFWPWRQGRGGRLRPPMSKLFASKDPDSQAVSLSCFINKRPGQLKLGW